MKKIKLVATFVLMIITMTTFTIISRATTGIVNEDTIKIRKEPREDSTVLDLLYEGDEVEILEIEDGWYKVKATTSIGKITGYIDQELIDLEDVEKDISEESQETTPVISTDIQNIEENKEYTVEQEVNVKILPLMNSRVNAKITGNIKVIEILNNWARIESNTEIGWIRISALKKSLIKIETTSREEQINENVVETISKETVQQEPEEPETIEMNKIGYVKTEGLRVRKGPSTDTEEITSLSKNDEVKITGQTGKWYKIDMDGKIGYVSAKYISDTKIAETTSRDGSTLKNETPAIQETPKAEETPVIQETPKVEETPATTPVAPSTTGNAIVEYAKKYLGYKYVSGGASPSTGFDCSGFTQYVYKQFGISLNRTSKAQINNGVAVEKSNLQPGDLVIFNNEANTAIGHVGIYVGDGNFIHASNPKDGVKITTLLSGYYKIRYVGARRVI